MLSRTAHSVDEPMEAGEVRVAFVSFAFGEYAVRLASALAENAEVGLWLTDTQAEPYKDRLDERVAFKPIYKPRMRQPLKQVSSIRRLYREIKAFNPDLIHLQQGYLWLNPILRLLRRYPLVVTVHDPVPHFGDRLGKKTPQFIANIAYRRADAIIVHNEQVERAMTGLGAETKPTFVVPHVALGEVERPESDDGDNVVLFFGRIWPYKGLEYLIKAEPFISEAVPDVRFIIAGFGEDLRRYKDMMVNPERFQIINEFIPAERAAELFNAASLVALPYVDATQSGVIPMAYHYSRPVVATEVGGLPSQIDHGETGYIVPPRDEKMLADAIVRILRDPDLKARLSANARAKADTELAPDAVAARTLEVYVKLLGSQQ